MRRARATGALALSAVLAPNLDLYIYTSWSEYTPTREGPWTPLPSEDFGGYPWTDAR